MSGILRDKTKIIIVILLVCAFCVGLVWLNAYSSELQYDINRINNQIQQTGWEIRALEVSVNTQSNITNLEQKAAELGMVYPNFSDIVYLRGDTPEAEDLALALRENVYR